MGYRVHGRTLSSAEKVVLGQSTIVGTDGKDDGNKETGGGTGTLSGGEGRRGKGGTVNGTGRRVTYGT